MNAAHSAPTKPGAARGTAAAGERATLAAVLDALADAVGAAHDHLRRASPSTRALIDEHESWPENFIWTDGSQVAKAARRIAALLRRHPDPSEGAAPARSKRRARRGT